MTTTNEAAAVKAVKEHKAWKEQEITEATDFLNTSGINTESLSSDEILNVRALSKAMGNKR